MKQNACYLATIERFGYTLQVLETSERKAKNALIKYYIDTYKTYNDGLDPSEEIDYRYGNTRTDLEIMKDEIFVREMPFGVIEWC